MRIQCVTTCSAAQWELYGRRMAETFVKYWEGPTLTIYGDGDCPADCPAGVQWRNLPLWHNTFKLSLVDNRDAHGYSRRSAKGPGKYDFRFDCVRFSHKIAAITDAALRKEHVPVDLLVWIDADTFTDKPITSDIVARWRACDGYISCLFRDKLYPECGFMIFECRHKTHRVFMDQLRKLYMNHECLRYQETHDSYIVMCHVRRFVGSGAIGEPYSLSGKHSGKHHVFVASEIGQYMDHLKGGRKVVGKSVERGQ